MIAQIRLKQVKWKEVAVEIVVEEGVAMLVSSVDNKVIA